MTEGWATREDVELVDREGSVEIAEAAAFAQASRPAPSVLLRDVFAVP